MRVGLVGAGAMGSALGAGWRDGGAEVVTTVVGRSTRTQELVAKQGIATVETFAEVVASDLVVSVVPPGSALAAADAIADTARDIGRSPLVADLNAVSPDTVAAMSARLGEAGLALVDGSLSGGPPTTGTTVRGYVSGPDAERFTAVANPRLDVVRLQGPVGQASALKMCTASMYKGTTALVMHAMITADRHGVLAEFLADVGRMWPNDVPQWPANLALSATKAARYVDEMAEIATTQGAAGLPRALFDGVGAAWARASESPLAQHPPESVDGMDNADVLTGLRTAPRRAVVFDFSGTLFHIEPPEHIVLAALGADELHRTPELVRRGAINGSNDAPDLPADLARTWAVRDLSPAAHRAAYVGVSVLAGLTDEQADALYARGSSPLAWQPYPDTGDVLRELRTAGVPVAVVSNIGWDPRPVLHRYGVADLVDVLVLSDERGVQKPDPSIFRMALDELGVPAADCVFVGDSPRTDGAAAEVGMRFFAVPADESAREPDTLLRAAGLRG